MSPLLWDNTKPLTCLTTCSHSCTQLSSSSTVKTLMRGYELTTTAKWRWMLTGFSLSSVECMFTKVLVQNSSQYWASTFNWRGKGIDNSYAQALLLLLFLYGISAKKAMKYLARSFLPSSICIPRREKETQKLNRLLYHWKNPR